MKAKNLNVTTRTGKSSQPSVDPGLNAMSLGVNRREFLKVALATAALLALTSCATSKSSKSDLDVAMTDLRNLLEEFEGDGTREARLVSLGRRIENQCQEFTENYIDYRRRFDSLSRRRETPSSELRELGEDYSTRREWYRNELLGAQDELRQTLTREEWDKVVQVLNSGADAFSQTTKERS